jgi:D-aspartate ligase
MAGWERAFDPTVPAVVLKLTSNVMHHGGLGAIRSLGRAGVPVYGVHERLRAPAASSRYLTGRFLWNPDPADLQQVTQGLVLIAERIGRPAVLIPTDDAGALYLAEHGSELRRWFLFSDPPADLPRRLADKYSLYQVCREMEISCPQVSLPDSLDQAREFALSAGYPLIAKLAAPWLSGGALPTTSIVRDADGLEGLYQRCAQCGVRLMLQEFIPGGAGHDWFFHGYCNASSDCHPAFTGVKVRSFPIGAGGTTFGRSVANEKLRELMTQLLARLKYRGIMDLDIRLDARDGKYNLLDFNPRLGAQFRIFRDTAGTDVVLAAYRDLTGQDVPFGEQLNGRTFMAESYDPLSMLAHWRRGELTPGVWLSEVRSLAEPAWFASDDLRPFGLMCLRMIWKTVSRPLRILRRDYELPRRAIGLGIDHLGRRRLRRPAFSTAPTEPGSRAADPEHWALQREER